MIRIIYCVWLKLTFEKLLINNEIRVYWSNFENKSIIIFIFTRYIMKPVFISQNFKKINNMSAEDKWKFVGKIVLGLFLVVVLFIVGVFLYFAKDLPSATAVDAKLVIQSTKIYDRSGQHLLYDVHGEEKRTIVPFNQIPDNVKYAAIALEDQTFYTHHGLDYKSILRSAYNDILKRGSSVLMATRMRGLPAATACRSFAR